MKIKVSSNGKEIIINIIDFLLLSQDINILHFSICKLIETFNELFSQLESEFILWKISESLVKEPYMHICNGMINMEIILNIHGIYEFPWVNIHQESAQQCSWLYHGSFLTPLKSFGISEPCESPSNTWSFLNIHMCVHMFQGLI